MQAHMWDMAKQTKMAAAMCNFDFRIFACFFYRFDGWVSSKDQTKDRSIVFNSVFNCCSQSLATLRYATNNEATKITANV